MQYDTFDLRVKRVCKSFLPFSLSFVQRCQVKKSIGYPQHNPTYFNNTHNHISNFKTMSKNKANNQMNNMSGGGTKSNTMSAAEIEASKKKLTEATAAAAEVEKIRLAAAKKLKKVKVSKEDLKTLMTEFLLSKEDATLALQRSGLDTGSSDIAKAMRSIVGAL